MRIFLLPLLFVVSAIAHGQLLSIDSLKRELLHAKTDSAKATIMYHIGNNYRFNNYDSALDYALRVIKISRPHFEKGEVVGYGLAGLALRYMGNYTMAIQYHLEGLKLAEKSNNEMEIFLGMQGLSMVYKDMDDFGQAFHYGLRAFQLAQNDERMKMLAAANLGDLYMQTNKLDSALLYENMAYRISLDIGNDYFKSFIYETLGEIQEKLGNTQLGVEYLVLSIKHAHAANLTRELAEATYTGSQLLLKHGQDDSAYHYAHIGLSAAQKGNYKLGIVNLSKSLEAYFEKKKKVDSAFFYYKLSANTREKILNDEKLRQIQNLQFNEQVRQQQIAAAAAEERESRIRNLQYFGIALFVLFFLTIVLVLSHVKVKPSVLEFLSIVGTLLLFEFVALLVHHYVGSITHHQPVYMILIMVCVAAILVPLHHKFEHWLKKRAGIKKDSHSAHQQTDISERTQGLSKTSS